LTPTLALILTSIFVFTLLLIEHKENNAVSFTIWIPTIWLLYSGSKQLGSWLNIHNTIEVGSAPDRIFLISLGLIGIFILIKRNFSWSKALRQNWLYFVILLYMFLSVLWSNMPGISFRRWGREPIGFIMACLIISENNSMRAFFSSIKKVVYIAAPFSLLLIKYYPTYGRVYDGWSGELQWVGISNQKNGLSILFAFCIFLIIWSLFEKFLNFKYLSYKLPILTDLIILFLSIYIMMGPKRSLTYSATSFFTLFTGIIIIPILYSLSKHRYNLKLIATLIILSIIIIGSLMPFFQKYPSKEFTQLLHRDSTLTGRTTIWKALIPYTKKKILFGYAYGGFWTTYLRENIAAHAHNGYLSTILDLGIVGLILYSTFIILISRKCVELIYKYSVVHILFLAMIFMFLIRNMTEISFGTFDYFPGSLILILSFMINSSIKVENSYSLFTK